MKLVTDGQTIRVAQSGPDFLILNEPATIPAGEAELIVTVEGEDTKRPFLIAEPVDGVRVKAERLQVGSNRIDPALAT
jgi:hypothetical protein